MSEENELRFVRIISTREDLVGYVTHYDEYIVIKNPLLIEIETYFDEGRQILSLQEYLPQSVISLQEVEIPSNDIMFSTPVKSEFVEQYEYIADFFYNNQTKLKTKIPQREEREEVKEEISETAKKVVSILEALQSKKDKPIH